MFSKVHSSQFTPKARLAEGGTVHRFKKTESCPPLTVNRKAGGFTLIELIIVIALWGILATIIMVAANPAKRINQAKDS